MLSQHQLDVIHWVLASISYGLTPSLKIVADALLRFVAELEMQGIISDPGLNHLV